MGPGGRACLKRPNLPRRVVYFILPYLYNREIGINDGKRLKENIMKKFIAQHLIATIAGVAIIVLAAGGWWYLATSKAPSFSTVTVGRGNVVQSVDEPGTVMTENSVNMSFEEAGQITQVNVKEGDTVSAGEILASLDTSSLMAGLEQASATLAAAEANLNALTAGTRPQQLQIDQSDVTSAESSVNSATASLGAAAGSAYTAADDAIHNQTDNLFSNIQSTNPSFLVPLSNSQTVINIVNARIALGGVLNTWYASVTATSSDPLTAANLASGNLQQVQSYLDTLALAVNGATPNSIMTASQLAGYKANIVVARTEVTAAISGLTTAQNALASAQAALTVAQNNLALAQAGSTSQQIEAQQAAVLQAQAGVASAQLAVNHAELVAPFAGTVQNLTAMVGQVVSPGVPVLSVVSSGGLKVEAYASETDVGKIAVGDTASVTLDAYGTGTSFPATVATIDNSETQVNGSPAYMVTLYFTNPDSRIKDGMTGNVHIVTAEHDNVIEVPSNLVINSNNGYVVLVKQGNATQDMPVTIGIVGNNGTTEITSGLNVGDQLINL